MSDARFHASASQLTRPEQFWGPDGKVIFNDPPEAVYVHVPFCKHRCGYCNFTLVAGRPDLVPTYLDAIETQLSATLAEASEPISVQTLYFGGGTPTQLPPRDLQRLCQLVGQYFELNRGGEWTVEANPADISPAHMEVLAEQGVTRVSLGIQSFQTAKLQFLERDHGPTQAEEACHRLAELFPHVSVDLIFGTPGETLSSWHRELERVQRLPIDHISTYGLTWEQGTAFGSRRRRGLLQPISDELEIALYEMTRTSLPTSGFQQYEVSSFARTGGRSRHNQTYWRGESYWGFGPGAAQYVCGQRALNHRSTTTWLRRISQGQLPWESSEVLSAEERARELLVFSLRQLDGIDNGEFRERSGWSLEELAGPVLADYQNQGWIAWNESTCRLTSAGLVISDSLWPRLL